MRQNICSTSGKNQRAVITVDDLRTQQGGRHERNVTLHIQTTKRVRNVSAKGHSAFPCLQGLRLLRRRFLDSIFYPQEHKSGLDRTCTGLNSWTFLVVSESSRADNSSNAAMKSDQAHLQETGRVHGQVWEELKPHAQKERRRPTRKWIKPSYLAPWGVQLSQWPSEWSGTPATPVSITVWRE